MSEVSVRATVMQCSPSGQLDVHHTVTGRIDYAPGPNSAICAALIMAVATVPRSGLSPETVERLAVCLRDFGWTPSAPVARPGIDATLELTNGHFLVRSGTLSYDAGVGRLAVPVPCATVALQPGLPGSFALHVYGCPRDRRIEDASLFLAPFCFSRSDALGVRLMQQPLLEAPESLPRHTSHRSKRLHAKARHAQTLQRLCLQPGAQPSSLQVMPDGALVCSTSFAGRDLALVTCHVPGV